MFRTSISIMISVIIIALISILVEYLYIPGEILFLAIAVVILFLAIICKVNEVKKIKFENVINNITKEIVYILKFILAVMVSYILFAMFNGT